jgi:hypothetical protein
MLLVIDARAGLIPKISFQRVFAPVSDRIVSGMDHHSGAMEKTNEQAERLVYKITD